MKIPRVKQEKDPRVNHLRGRAQEARSKQKFREAERLDSWANSLSKDRSIEDKSESAEPPPKLILPRAVKRFAPTKKAIAVKTAVAPKPPPKKAPVHDLDHMLRYKSEKADTNPRPQDRTQLLIVAGKLPYLNPLANVGANSKNGSGSEVAQFGLAGTGACLMAVEPAAGGILLMFSCVLDALTSENSDDVDEHSADAKPERVEEGQAAGLFTASPCGMSWLIA